MQKLKIGGVDHVRASDVADLLEINRGMMAKVLKDERPQLTTIGRTIYVRVMDIPAIRAGVKKRHDWYKAGCRERANKLNARVRAERELEAEEKEQVEEMFSSEKEKQYQKDSSLEVKLLGEISELKKQVQNMEALLVRLCDLWK